VTHRPSPIIVNDRVYTDLSAAIKDNGHETFVYQMANLKPATVPTGELIMEMVAKAMFELNPKSAANTDLWPLFVKDVKYECHQLSSKMTRFAEDYRIWVPTEEATFTVDIKPAEEEE